jgi:dTDP-4-dehydrorhamnose 3,5-epimerase
MPYLVNRTPLNDVLVLVPSVHNDDRGFFFESFNQRDFSDLIGREVSFVQDNHSRSGKGVLRGMHFQSEIPQGKLVRVIQGEIFDVAVDITEDSPNFGKWTSAVLSENNKHQLWVPPGFAHGFLVLSDYAEVLYKTTEYWVPKHDRSLAWDDSTVGIVWPLVDCPLLAAKDASAKKLIEHFPGRT